MTRTGKIARLPKAIRDELNRRLDDNELGIRLLDWLNGLPEVQQVLNQDFNGCPINKVNLTHWRQGGFLDWRSFQREIRLGLFSGLGCSAPAVKPNSTSRRRRMRPG